MSGSVIGPLSFEYDSGWRHDNPTSVFVFGDRKVNADLARASFANVDFSFLHQTHSDVVVKKQRSSAIARHGVSTQPQWPEGDAHWTCEPDLALCIRTADCIPVLIAAPGAVAAIHAGWRGLDSSLISKTLRRMSEEGIEISKGIAVIGPHIGRASFEVGRDVADRLNGVYRTLRYNPAPIVFRHPSDETKRLVDMSTLAKAQLIDGGIDERSIGEIACDTLTDPNFHSYRRDGAAAGRQISFVYMKSSV